MLLEATNENLGEVVTFADLLAQYPGTDLRLWKLWYFQSDRALFSLAEDLLILALAGLVLVWYRRSEAHALRRYSHLRQVFGSGDNFQ